MLYVRAQAAGAAGQAVGACATEAGNEANRRRRRLGVGGARETRAVDHVFARCAQRARAAGGRRSRRCTCRQSRLSKMLAKSSSRRRRRTLRCLRRARRCPRGSRCRLRPAKSIRRYTIRACWRAWRTSFEDSRSKLCCPSLLCMFRQDMRSIATPVVGSLRCRDSRQYL
jgi:hypothetical protein